jgi:hypothetical protein
LLHRKKHNPKFKIQNDISQLRDFQIKKYSIAFRAEGAGGRGQGAGGGKVVLIPKIGQFIFWSSLKTRFV